MNHTVAAPKPFNVNSMFATEWYFLYSKLVIPVRFRNGRVRYKQGNYKYMTVTTIKNPALMNLFTAFLLISADGLTSQVNIL